MSGVRKRAEPMPEWMEKCLGQPALMSIPLTSPITFKAAWVASAGEADPSWKISLEDSNFGYVLKTRVSGLAWTLEGTT